MKSIVLVLLLFPTLAIAKTWDTNLFSIDLPESMHVETDKERRLLAMSENGPNSPPFLSIEFGAEFPTKQVLKSINQSLADSGGKMVKEKCGSNCKAYYFENEVQVEGQKVFQFHYLVETKDLGFVISYLGSTGLDAGRQFVHDIGDQIRAKRN